VASIFLFSFWANLGCNRYKTHQNTVPCVESFGDPEFWPLKEAAWEIFLHLALDVFWFCGEAKSTPF